MIERAFVQVGGPPGSGKTTFIEAMLAGAGTLTLAARCLRDDTLAQARESAPRTHPELRRYRQAGAADTALYTFPGQQSGTDDFFMTNLMTDYSQAVVLEGDSPLDYVDLRVFVAPAPARTEQLFVRRTRRRSPDEAAGGPALRHLLSEPGDLAEALARIGAEPLAEFARNNPALVDKIRAVLGEVIAEPASASPRGSEKRWSVADAYAGIEHAGLVVVNSRHGGNRRAAEALVADVVRLRKDKDLAADILGTRGNRIPVTAVVADLADPNDLGRKKAIARTRRAIRSRSS
ncbi:MAG: hypothetical protein M0Z82_02815 [Actinomycetota bacterium]|nr:hypothetical protein [Actinomycetota bacterium]